MSCAYVILLLDSVYISNDNACEVASNESNKKVNLLNQPELLVLEIF